MCKFTASAKKRYLAALLPCCTVTCTAAQPATLAVITDLNGITEPCGCTSQPLGGLDHVAGRLGSFASAEPVGLVTVGSTFFSFATPPPTWEPQERSKADAIAQIMHHLAPAAMIPGPFDTAALRPALEDLLSRQPLPIMWQPASVKSVTLGRTRVGLIGIPGELDAALVNPAAVSLRQAGAQLVVALVAQGRRGGGPQATALRGVDAVVVAGVDGPPGVQLLDNTVLLYGGAQGEFIGLLRLTPRRGAGWTFFDGGATARRGLEARYQRLQTEAEHLPPGPGRQARLAKAQSLKDELATVQATTPPGSSFNWDVEAIEQRVASASWAKDILTAYNRSLCAPALAASALQPCTAAATPSERFVGSQVCQACHAAAWSVYSTSAHAHAWSTLERTGKNCDLSCVGCHSVGFQQPGGFCHLADAKTFGNVGCENCHGAAAGHVAAPQDRSRWPTTFLRSPPERVCRGCHTPTHSDRFDYATYLPKIIGPGHGQPLPAAP